MMNRREALTRIGALFGAGVIGARAGANAVTSSTADLITSATTAAGETGPITIAHITDTHVFEKNGAEKWMSDALHHIQSQAKKPALILNTGDSVMETLKADRARADVLWKLWRDTLQRENSLPVYHTLGNHDVWGLAVDDAAVKSDPSYGKKRGLDGLGIEKSYYSFDRAGWHFIALDTIIPYPEHETGWIGGLDDEQFAWLEKDLAATPANRNVIVYSHLPIVTVAYMRTQAPDEMMTYHARPHGSIGDARRVIDLFAKHPNVKLCLSGHIHLLDRVELAGVTYICDGALSGGWWKGNRLDVAPGYSLTTLNADGSFDYEYIKYGWDDRLVEPIA